MKRKLVKVLLVGVTILSGFYLNVPVKASETENTLPELEKQIEDNVTEEDFTYIVLEDGTAEITGYTGENKESLMVPGTIGGYKVTSIGDYAFSGCQFLGNLSLPDGLVNVGEHAFERQGFTGNLHIPDTVTSIGAYAFYGCRFTGDLIVPESVKTIGECGLARVTQGNSSYVHTNYLKIDKIQPGFSEKAFIESVSIHGKWVMRAGEKYQCSVNSGYGHLELPSFMIAGWSSADPNIATVDENGMVTAVGVGQTKIIVRMYNGIEASEELSVDKKVDGINQGNITWYIPQKIKLGYEFRNPNGRHNINIGRGLAIGKTNGLSKFADGKHYCLCAADKRWGSVFNYLPAGVMDEGCLITADEVYSNFNGFYAVRLGSITFQLSIVDASNNWEKTPLGEPYTVTVEEPVIETNEPTQVSVGDTITLKSELQNTDLQNKSVLPYKEMVKDGVGGIYSYELIYEPQFTIEEGANLVECSNGDFSHMLKASEQLKFKGTGTVKIKVRYQHLKLDIESGDFYSPEKTITIQVKEKSQNNAQSNKKTQKVSKITLSGISNKIAAGKKIKLTAKVSPSNAANKKVKWKSSNTKVATVNSSGVVTLKKNSAGKTVRITATATDGSGVKAQYKITSMKGAVKKVTISGGKSVKAGKTLKLKGKVVATHKKANTKLKWTSSSKKYATVINSGKLKTYKAGKGKTVKITAEATDGSGKKKTVIIKIK